MKRAVGEGCRAGILHPAKDELLDGYLGILGKGICQSNAVGEKAERRRGLGERAQRFVASDPGRDVVFERNISHPLAKLLKLAGNDRDQIGAVRDLLLPVIGLRSEERRVGKECRL